MKNRIGKTNYLKGSVILYNKLPFYVVEVVDNIPEKDLIGVFDPKGDRELVPMNSDLLDFTPPRLGYVNIINGMRGITNPLYLFRQPSRSWKQGLTRDNTYCFNFTNRNPGHFDIISYFNPLRDCIANKYPTLSVAMENVAAMNKAKAGGHQAGVAFDRNLAIDKEYGLHYKGRNVGCVVNLKKGILLKKECSFLKESLEEKLNVKVSV